MQLVGTSSPIMFSPFELINEEVFDDETTMGYACTGSESAASGTEAEEELRQNSISTRTQSTQYFYQSKGVQTGCPEKHFCGLIEVTDDYKIYTMNCFYCDDIFPIWSWTKFVQHIQEKHRMLEQRTFIDADRAYTETDCTKKLQQRTAIFKVYPEIEGIQIEEIKIECEAEEELANVEDKAVKFKKKAKKKNSKKVANDEDLNLPNDVYFEEVSTIVKVEVDDDEGVTEAENKEECDDCSASGDNSGDENVEIFREQRPRDANQIYLLRDKPALVNDLLNLWKAYPLLWHNRSSQIDDGPYDASVAELTDKLNTKWNLSKTSLGINRSLYKIRKWFYSAREKTNATVKFYEKCEKFLPKRCDLPLSCDKCVNYFANEQQLREHYKRHETYCTICRKDYRKPNKYRQHAIIHRPPTFACELCDKKYHRRPGLLEHMQAHRNERNYVCDKCGKGFVRQKNLRDHTIQVHSDDPALREHPCKICGEQCKTWVALTKHKQIQHLVLEGTIEELAKKRTKSRKLNVMTVFDPVTKTDRIVCDVCGKTYRFSGAMVRHKVSAHGYIKPILRRSHKRKVIRHIKREYMVLEGVKEELEKHRIESQKHKNRKHIHVYDPVTKTNRIACDVCGNTYRFSGAMVRHKVRAHGYVKPTLRQPRKKKIATDNREDLEKFSQEVDEEEEEAVIQQQDNIEEEEDDDDIELYEDIEFAEETDVELEMDN